MNRTDMSLPGSYTGITHEPMKRFMPLVALLLWACRKDTRMDPDGGRAMDWMPLKLKSIWIYQVDSFGYNGSSNIPDTFRFQVRELVDTFFTDNLNETAARIRLDVRADSSSPWLFQRMVYMKVNSLLVERVDNNRRFVKLSFPATPEAVWNLNERNDLPPAFLYYEQLYHPFPLMGVRFDSCLAVSGTDVKNNLEESAYREVFGKNKGLLFRRITDKRIQAGKIYGYEMVYRLREYR